jgi:hypothetical protein
MYFDDLLRKAKQDSEPVEKKVKTAGTTNA